LGRRRSKVGSKRRIAFFNETAANYLVADDDGTKLPAEIDKDSGVMKAANGIMTLTYIKNSDTCCPPVIILRWSLPAAASLA
jgi:hypothetical protein